MTPREARTAKDFMNLENFFAKVADHKLLVQKESVTIGVVGFASISIPRATFEAFIDWYNTGKFKNPRKRKENVG